MQSPMATSEQPVTEDVHTDEPPPRYQEVQMVSFAQWQKNLHSSTPLATARPQGNHTTLPQSLPISERNVSTAGMDLPAPDWSATGLAWRPILRAEEQATKC